MFYFGYHFLGMHIIWWFVWAVFIYWIFLSPYSTGQRKSSNDDSLEILKRRYASGEIKTKEYIDQKNILGV